MTDKQERFIDYYCIYLNATKAALKAGYSKSTSYAIGSELMQKPHIRDKIEFRLSELTQNAKDEAIHNIVFWRNIRDNPKSRMADRLKASEFLGRYHGMFVDRFKGQLDVSGELTTGNVSDDERNRIKNEIAGMFPVLEKHKEDEGG